MAVKKMRFDEQKSNIPDTLIPIETTFTGNIETNASVRIDGRIKGNVKAKGDVTLGPKALIEGDVFGMSFNIAGTITGNIIAGGSVTVLAKSHVLGDITSMALNIEQGASYSGKCTVGTIESAKIKPRSGLGNVLPNKQPESGEK